MISDNYYPKKRKDILQEDLEEGCVIYKKKNEVYTLNTSVDFVWEDCDGHNNLEQISQELASSCDLKVEDVIDEAVFLRDEQGMQ